MSPVIDFVPDEETQSPSPAAIDFIPDVEPTAQFTEADFADDSKAARRAALQQEMAKVRSENRFSNWFAQQNQSVGGATESALQEGQAGAGGILKGIGAATQAGFMGVDPETGASMPGYAERLARPAGEVMRDIQRDPVYVAGQALQETAPEVHPVPQRERESFITKAAGAAGQFVPVMAAGSLAPLAIGLQSAGDHISNDYEAAKSAGKSDDEAARDAMTKAVVSGGMQAAIFAILPKPLRDAGDKFLVDKFGNAAARLIAKRVAQAGETGALFGASHAGEQAIEGQNPLEGLPTAIAGGALMGAVTPRGVSKAEQAFLPEESSFFDPKFESFKLSLLGGDPGAETEMVRTSQDVLEPHKPPTVLLSTGGPSPIGGEPTQPYVLPEPGPMEPIPRPGSRVPAWRVNPQRQRIQLAPYDQTQNQVIPPSPVSDEQRIATQSEAEKQAQIGTAQPQGQNQAPAELMSPEESNELSKLKSKDLTDDGLSKSEEQRMFELSRKESRIKRSAKTSEEVGLLREAGVVVPEDFLHPSDGVDNHVTGWTLDKNGFIQIRVESHTGGTMSSKLITVKPGDVLNHGMNDTLPGTTRARESNPDEAQTSPAQTPPGQAPPPDAGAQGPTAVSQGEVSGEGAVTKEPWQMTKAEYLSDTQRRIEERIQVANQMKDAASKPAVLKVLNQQLESAKSGNPTIVEVTAPEIGKGGSTRNVTRKIKKADFTGTHKALIEEAIKEGKPVPAEVLADYPDLKPASETEVAEPSPTPETKPSTGEPPPPKKPTTTSAPVSSKAVLRSEKQIKISTPEGATQIRVTTADGKASVQSIADLKKENTFRGVDAAKIESGTIDKTGKFKPMAGEVKIEPRLAKSGLTEDQQKRIDEARAIRSGIQNENRTDPRVETNVEGNRTGMEAPADSAGEQARIKQDLQSSGQVLWTDTGEINRIFTNANKSRRGADSPRTKVLVTGKRVSVRSDQEMADRKTFQETRVFLGKDDPGDVLGRAAAILAHRLLVASGKEGPALFSGERVSDPVRGQADVLRALFVKLKDLRVMVREFGPKDSTLAKYENLPGLGDFISINAKELAQSNFSDPVSLARWDSVLTEELLHSATARVTTRDEISNVWHSLTPNEQAITRHFYDPDNRRPNMTPYELGMEYTRMILQDRLSGKISEHFQGGITGALKKVLEKVLNFLRETFGSKPESDIARQIIERIESAIKGEPPIEQSVFDRGPDTIASGIHQAGEKSAEDERFGDTVQYAGVEYNILGKDKMTPEQKQAGDAKAQQFVGTKLKLPGEPDMTYGKQRGSTDLNVVFRITPDGFNYDQEGRQLLDHITQQVQMQFHPGGDPAYVASLSNMVAKNFNEGNFNGVFSPPLIDELFALTASDRSAKGQMLRALTGLRDDLTGIAHNVSAFLRRTYAQEFGGDGVIDKVIKRMATDFREYFTETELADVFKNHPALTEFFDRVKLMMRQESEDRLYRIIQGKFKPKTARKLSVLEANAVLSEEASKIIEELGKLGIEPKEVPGKKKLEPMESLRLMMAGKTQERVEADVERAIASGERNAGIKEALAREANTGRREEMAALFTDGVEEPSPEMIEAGLQRPEFAHWKTIRDNWTGYSPTSMDLVQKVIRGEFKGTKFADPKEKPADTRINLEALAKSPEAEVARVMDGFMENVRKQIDLGSATPQAKQRVERMIKAEVTDQLAKAKQRVLDNYFRVRDIANAPTASQRLKQLLNAGGSRDPRFTSDRVRQLIKRVSREYIKGPDFDALATSTRAEKSQWLETKAEEIARRENFNVLDEKTRDYLDAVVRTHLAERIQAGEEKVARQFLKGSDVSYDPNPIDPKARERSLEAAKSKLEGIIRAGGFDTAMVESVASKSAVSKLTPKMGDLIKEVFSTPLYRQDELSQRFSDALVKQLGIDPAIADKGKAVFDQAFRNKFKAAKARAFETAKAALNPQERVLFSKRALWQKIERAVNAGVFDSADVLQGIAKERGYSIPEPADVAGMKDLALREQRMRELSPDKKAAMEAAGKTPAEIEEARRKVESVNIYKRAELIKRMGVLWSRMVRPLPLAKNPGTMAKLWWEHKRNWAQALNEMETFNMLAKAGFTLYRLPMHLTTQLLGHLPTRAIGRAMELRKLDLANGNPTAFWKDVATAMQDSGQATLRALRPALVSARAEMLGRGESRNVDRLLGGINAMERLFLKAKQFSDNGDYARASITHLFAWPRVISWYISAVDHWQGTPVEYQEIIHQIEMSMREKGRSSGEIDTFKQQVFDMMKSEVVGATAEARQILERDGETVTDAQAREAGWQLVRRNIYGAMKRAGLAADDFEADNKILADTQSWQVPTARGVGTYAAMPVRLIGKVAESVGLPISFGRFSNAIATSINYSLMWTPFYKLADIKGPGIEGSQPSTWFRTDLDRSQRLAQAVLGTVMGGTALALMQAGVLRMTPSMILNKEERDAFERQGHKANTAEFVLPGGQFIPVSVLVGPLTLIAPYLYAGGAVQRLMEKRNKEQAKLNEEAKRHGVAPGKIKPIGVVDIMAIGAETAWGTTLGNRTVSGLTASATEYGSLNAKKQISAYLSPLIPGLPGYQEVSRMEGVNLDSKLASVWDYMVPLPTSKARAVNMLGDPVGTPNDLQRVVQVMTSGTFPWSVDPKDAEAQKPYAVLFQSGYHPPSVNPGQGYIVKGELRPLNDAELQQFAQARGESFKQILSRMAPGADDKAVKQAFQAANASALASVGAATVKSIETAGSGSSGASSDKLPTERGIAGATLPSTGAATGRVPGPAGGSGRVSTASRLKSSSGLPRRRIGAPGRAKRLVSGRLSSRGRGRIRLSASRRKRPRIRAYA